MTEYSMQSKKAWEYNANNFWVREAGTPAEPHLTEAEQANQTVAQL